MQTLEGRPPVARRRAWCFWSTTESIQNEVPSVTAILETLIAVPLYWWIALHVGVVQPLLISALIAPLVLLRSEESVALGIRWFVAFERRITYSVYTKREWVKNEAFWIITTLCTASAVALTWVIMRHIAPLFAESWVTLKISTMVVVSILCVEVMLFALSVLSKIPFPHVPSIAELFSPYRDVSFPMAIVCVPGLQVGVLIVANCIRMAATLAHLREGVKVMPRNFRRLDFCTSPLQIPEIVPGIEGRLESEYRFSEYLWNVRFYNPFRPADWSLAEHWWTFIWDIVAVIVGFALYFPAWLYRLTIKSTAWFWWPLAFLGGDLKKARNPALIRWDVMGSLWAKASIITTCISLGWFAFANLVLSGAMFHHNPFLTPIGYLFWVKWSLRPWQICGFAASALSILLVFWVDDVSGKYRIAQDTNDAELIRAEERKFGWIERLARLRLVFVILFWCLVGAHATLYVNSTRCWSSLPPRLHTWAQDIYGDRLPPEDCSKQRGPPT
jgi:hypothetical protein